MRMSGLRLVSGSWKMMPMRRPRITRIRAGGRLSMRSPLSRISPPAIRPGGSRRPMMASAGQRLAGARLADDAQNLARRDVERDAVERGERPLSRREFDSEIADRKQRAGHFSLGLSASRNQSPSRFTASTSAASVRLGKRDDPPFAREQVVLPDADQGSERGLGRRQADAEKGERRLGDDREREIDGRDHQDRPHHVGKDMGEEDARVRKPDQPRRQHVIAVLLHHRRGAHGARVLHPERQADREDEHGERRLRRGLRA